MQRLLVAAALAANILSTSAFAAGPSLGRGVVAEISTAGMFRPRTAPASTGVRIMTDGKVITFATYDDGRMVTKQIATLARDRVLAIKAEVANLPESELVSANPDLPGCMDAPSTTVLAKNARGVTVALTGRVACLDQVRADGEYTLTPQVLEGLSTLGNLGR